MSEAALYTERWKKTQKGLLKEGADCAYLYAHIEADTDEPFYIGMGETVGRPWQRGRTNKHKNRANKHGLRVHVEAMPNLTWENSLWWEVRWIKAFRDAGYDLVNLTDGGEGTKGWLTSEKTKEKMRGPRPIISQQKQGHWTGDKNPNKKPENKEKISVRMTVNNPLFRPEVVVLRSGENHHSKKKGWVSPNLGKPNKAVSVRMLTNNPMLNHASARKAQDTRKANGNGWEGDKNPSSKMTREQLLARGQKSAATRKLKGKSSATLYMAWEYKFARPYPYWGA